MCGPDTHSVGAVAPSRSVIVLALAARGSGDSEHRVHRRLPMTFLYVLNLHGAHL